MIELVSIAKLRSWPGNARKHGPDDLKALAASLSFYGQTKNIVVQKSTLRIVAGHGTVEAATALGWKEIRAKLEDWDDATCEAYCIADNATAENSEWDFPRLKDKIVSLDLGDGDELRLGFTPKRLKGIFDFEPEGEKLPSDSKDSKTVTCPDCGHEFTP